MPFLSPNGVRIVKTINLWISTLLTGMTMAITGPTLLDLQNIVHTDTEHIAFVFTTRSIGYVVGSVLGGFIFDLTDKKQFVFAMTNLLNSSSMFAIPWCREIAPLTGFMIGNGVAMGILDTGASFCVLNLWGKDNGPYFQALHFFYGLGAFIAPLIAAPFLEQYLDGEEIPDIGNVLNVTLVETAETFFDNSTNSTLSGIPPVTYAYTIIGVIGIFVFSFFFVVSLSHPIDISAVKEENIPTRSNSLVYVAVVVFVNFLLLVAETGIEVGFPQMVTAYSVLGPLHLTKTVGSYITSAFWGAFTLARFMSVFFSLVFTNKTMLALDIVVASVGAGILQAYATSEEWSLWVASVLMGAGMASVFPSTVGWIDEYIPVNTRILSVFIFGVASGEMIVPYVISKYIVVFPEILIYVSVVTCILSGLAGIIIYLVLRGRPTKYLTEDELKANQDDVIKDDVEKQDLICTISHL